MMADDHAACTSCGDVLLPEDTRDGGAYGLGLLCPEWVVYLLRADKYRKLGWRSPERQNGTAERTMMGSRRLSEPG
jgi:hypothetical protein